MSYSFFHIWKQVSLMYEINKKDQRPSQRSYTEDLQLEERVYELKEHLHQLTP